MAKAEHEATTPPAELDPIFARIARYRLAVIAEHDALNAEREARDLLDVNAKWPAVRVSSRDILGAPAFNERAIRCAIEPLIAEARQRGWKNAMQRYEREREAKIARLKTMQANRDFAKAQIGFGEIAGRARAATNERGLAERALRWAIARTPAGIANMARLLADEIERVGNSPDHGYLLWAAAREMFVPFAQQIEKSAARLTDAAAMTGRRA